MIASGSKGVVLKSNARSGVKADWPLLSLAARTRRTKLRQPEFRAFNFFATRLLLDNYMFELMIELGASPNA